MEPFDKKRCLDNIYFLAKQKGKKIGELEELAGVSTGYLSRANKEDSTSKLTIDLIVAIAQALAVSVDKLVSYDLSGLSPNERRIVEFIEKLEKDTMNGDISWEKYQPPSGEDIKCYEGGITSCCLFLHRDNKPFYNSYFFPDQSTTLVGDYFAFDMDEEVRVVLTKVNHADAQGDDFELYFYVENNYNHECTTEPVCGTIPTVETQFDAILRRLYDVVTDASKNVKLSPLARSIINRYMGDQPNTADDSDNDRLPF